MICLSMLVFDVKRLYISLLMHPVPFQNKHVAVP